MTVQPSAARAVSDAVRRAAEEDGAAGPPAPEALTGALGTLRPRTDDAGDRACRLLGADAVAFGSAVLFRRGRYQPGTMAGQVLIAHEAAHVAHQVATGRAVPRRQPSAEVLARQQARAMAEAMSPEELDRQIQLLRARLAAAPAGGLAENLAALEEVAMERQGTARQAPPAAPAPAAPPAAPARAAPLPASVVQSPEHQRLMAAIMGARWPEAAELLNAYNAEGIRAVLATLTPRQVESVHLGAVTNGRVGRNAQVAQVALAAAPGLAAARATAEASGLTMEEVADYTTMTRGDFMDRHGFRRFWQVRDRIRALPDQTLGHLLPAEDETLYMFASGRTGTRAQETAARLREFRPPSPTGAVAGLTARAFTDDPNVIGAVTAAGDLVETGLSGVAPRAAIRGMGATAGPGSSPALVVGPGGTRLTPPPPGAPPGPRIAGLLPPGPQPYGLLPPGPQPRGLLPPGPQPRGLLPPGPQPYGLLPPGPQPRGLLPAGPGAEYRRVADPAAVARLPVLGTIQPLGPLREGSVVPRSFTMRLEGGGEVWVSGAATEHFTEALAGFREYYAPTGRGDPNPGAVLRETNRPMEVPGGRPALLGPREIHDDPGMRGQFRPGANEIARGSTTQFLSTNPRFAEAEFFNRQGPAASTVFASALVLEDFRAAVSEAVRTGVPYGQRVVVGNWELILQPPQQPGQLPAVTHANPAGRLDTPGSRPLPRPTGQR